MFFREWRGVHSRDVKRLPELEHIGAEECHVEVARARAVRIEGLVVSPPKAGHGAAAQNDLCIVRYRAPKHVDEALEPRFISVKSKLDNSCSHGVALYFRHYARGTLT